ncbi:hypothetical protein [Neobacillus cucumis]|uniref:hypothetical protein n=1 Tax=Neobacillus cucumis TaxID=1740721 RepID=UPI001965B8E5|nr:hypothetical protein [Neobacillus cucumis]MBM7653286.1 hypothetical protein [Neobacillus cucumis]
MFPMNLTPLRILGKNKGKLGAKTSILNPLFPLLQMVCKLFGGKLVRKAKQLKVMIESEAN